jgi:hypothetical protein
MSDRIPPWFKCNPDDFIDNMALMPVDPGHLYTAIFMRIFSGDGPTADDHYILARRTALTPKRAKLALEWLIARGMVTRLDDGRLDIGTTHACLDERTQRCTDAKHAANSRHQKSQQYQQNVDAPALRGHTDSREEDSREKKESPPSLRSGGAPPVKPVSKKLSKGSRIPDGWQPSEALFAFGEKEGFTPSEIKRAAAKFADHWRSKAGREATKSDWGAAFRNWLRSDTERLKGHRNGSRQKGSLVETGLGFVAQFSDGAADDMQREDSGDVSDDVVRLLSSR